MIKTTSDGKALVNTGHVWVPIETNPPPLGVKLLLINQWLGVATIGVWRPQDQFTHWSGLPIFEKEITCN